jgi:hypothetical protein
MIYNVLRMGIPVVDLCEFVPVLHQNHDYRHVPKGRVNSWEGPEADSNRRLAGAKERLRFSIADATHIVMQDGSLHPNPHKFARQLRLWIAMYSVLKWPLEVLFFPFLFSDQRRRRKLKVTFDFYATGANQHRRAARSWRPVRQGIGVRG